MRILVRESWCNICSHVTKYFVVHVGNGKFIRDYEGCSEDERRIKGEPIDVKEVLNLLMERKKFFEDRIDEDKNSARETKHAIRDITRLQKENDNE